VCWSPTASPRKPADSPSSSGAPGRRWPRASSSSPGWSNALEEPLGLLPPGQVEHDLDHVDAVAGQVLLPAVDVPVALAPDVAFPRCLGQALRRQQVRMYPDDQHFLVVRPVEDADPPPGGQRGLVAPEEIVLELGRRRLPEAADLHACGLTPLITCLIVLSLPAASSPWRTISRPRALWAASLSWYPASSGMPSSSRASASRRFSPAVAAGSWSRLSRTGVPGATRIGSVRSFMKPRRLPMSSAMPRRASAYHRHRRHRGHMVRLLGSGLWAARCRHD
jgi:hypothetical protein